MFLYGSPTGERNDCAEGARKGKTMSADNMVYLQHCHDGKWRAWHGFSSDYEDGFKPKARPKSGFIVEADSREAAIVAAHDWTTQNYTEYGVVELEPEQADGTDKSSSKEESRVSMGGVELPELPHPEGADVFGADYTADQMRAFYAAGVKAERERCAKICEEIEKRYLDAWKSNARDPSDFVQGQSDGAGECGTAIRKQNPPA
jgi:hypothetical protein